MNRQKGIKRAVLLISTIPFISGIFLAILITGEDPYYEGPYVVAVLLAIMWACIFFVVVWLCYFAVVWGYFVMRWIIKGFRDENKSNSTKV
jgi:hypothetical protein